MHNYFMSAAIIFYVFFSSIAYADEDVFEDYSKDLQKPAEASSSNVYDAWGDNMANLIERRSRDGIVIDGEGEYADGKVHADGVGNVVIDKNANVGPVINKLKIKDSTIVIKNNNRMK